jgi:SAM-dependent methyltransferase
MLDVGCSYTGSCSARAYRNLFPQTVTFLIDEKLAPLQFEHGSDKKICAEAQHLPIKSGSFGSVNASYLPGVAKMGVSSPPHIFREIYRILAPDGIFLFNCGCCESSEDLRDAVYGAGFSYLHHLGRIEKDGDPVDLFAAIKGMDPNSRAVARRRGIY